jgi:hypothetical protein
MTYQFDSVGLTIADYQTHAGDPSQMCETASEVQNGIAIRDVVLCLMQNPPAVGGK